MSEEEQAKMICDAIDALLRGEEPEMELDDQQFIELLRIARLRRQAGQALDVLSVLGVYELPEKLDEPPWPVCRGYDEPAYYVISFVEPTDAGTLRARKDVWWNRRTQHVDLIELFDESGQRYLSAALDDYRRYDGAEVATKIRITWFEQKLVLDLKLKDVEINSPDISDKNFVHIKPRWADN